MYCTNCGAPVRDDQNFCTSCGTKLTAPQQPIAPSPEQSTLLEQTTVILERGCDTADETALPAYTSPNQVWNTPDNSAEDAQNTKHAFIALGVAVALIIALIAAVCLWAPSLDFDLDLDDWFSGSAEPEPDIEAVWELAPSAVTDGMADDEFLYDFEQMLLYSWYSDGSIYWLQKKEYLFLSQYLNYGWEDAELMALAMDYLDALRTITDAQAYDQEEDYYIEDLSMWLEGWIEKCRIIIEMTDRYIHLSGDETAITDYYTAELSISAHELEAEKDLKAQLIGIDPSHNSKGYYTTYTNNTQCAMDVTFYNDYETEDDYLWEDDEFIGVQPGETITIMLEEMPDEYENWYVDWFVYTLYIDGVDIYEYY